MFTSSTIRKLVAKNVSKAKTVTTANPMKFEPQKVHFPGVGSSNNAYYGSLSRSDNLRVPLALFVPDGMLHQESRMTQKGAIIDVTWKGTISYPANASFLFKIPTIYQLPFLSELTGQTKGFPLLLSEGIFCGMAVDGAMNPYTQIWTTTVSVQDLRLTSKGKLGSKRGWIEALLRPLLK